MYQAGILLFISNVCSGNHNDLFKIIAQFQRLAAWCVATGISLKSLQLNTDKNFVLTALSHFSFRHSIIRSVKKHMHTRKNLKSGPKQ